MRFYLSPARFSKSLWGFKRYPHPAMMWVINLGKRDLFIYW